MRLGGAARRSVNHQVSGRWWFERRSASLDGAARVAVLAQWSRAASMTRSVSTLVQELQAHGYRVVVASACEDSASLEWADGVDLSDLTVLRKPNLGYDFGSWGVALTALPTVGKADRVLLLNDSMAGPFISLRPLLEAFDATNADVWGLTDTYQFGHHLQSYVLGFADGVLADRPLRDFWANIRHETSKDQIILRNEIGLSRLLEEEGYLPLPAFSHESLVVAGENPVIVAWRELLTRGFPFLKREILRNPSVAPGGRSAPLVLKRMFDVDVDEWVEERVS